MKQSMTLEQFNTWYWKNFPKSSYRRGQAFCELFIRDADWCFHDYVALYEEKDQNTITNLIWKIILQYDWDCTNLAVVRPDLLKV